MRATLIRPRELGPRECARWLEFQAADPQLQSPFLAPAFACAVDFVSDDARVAVFEDGAAIVGFLPFQMISRGVAAPIGRKLNTRQGFIHQPGLVWAWTELLAATGLHVLELQDVVGAQGAGFRSLVAASSPMIDTAGGWSSYLASIRTHKSVKTILYKERKLRRDHGDDVVFETGRAVDCADLDRLAKWKSRQYRRSGWPDLFAQHETVPLLRLLAEGHGDGMRAVGSSLRIRGEVVATDLSLSTDTVFAGWFAAHNPEHAQYSPGAIRTLRTIEAAFARGVRCIDLSRGDEQYKNALTNNSCDIATGFVSRQSLRSRVYKASRWPGTALTGYVLAHPGVRSVVRHSLRRIGEAREQYAMLMG
ncbi:hypothetical protein CRI77_12150 [Mycolicibacterium duvalii]|uniref:BioF2-like acetyltransferase domain-containing protein n=1 Tax=Mycolicibacterium duvalii TaxID=39688 RepID=A0A7I7K7V8_9MYCO|nr:GNAT family N-acetyltransferase [Mycolicibacterium duvalii]MCV7366270.1 GNAT family N-acetyltransferase [Mycolicibacterium duvalii]PEG41047.1 hypothetical protein CRI77_12150 [Mycolicibacterium duvalii]BBX20097.1 hypothetical protein MDUV_49570 [Mycolicibacterium duvalii]